MACNISLGRLEGCKDTVGGLAAIYFINYGEASFVADGVNEELLVSALPADPDPLASIYKYDLRGTSTFDQALTSSRDNGTTVVEQTLTVSLKKQDATTHKEVKLLAYGRPHIIVEDNNGDFWVLGEEFGAEMSATTSTGAAMGDKSGYELTFVASERRLARKYESTLGIATDFSIVNGI